MNLDTITSVVVIVVMVFALCGMIYSHRKSRDADKYFALRHQQLRLELEQAYRLPAFDVFIDNDRVKFKIGVQTFSIDYEPEDDDENSMAKREQLIWMAGQLKHALLRLQASPATPESIAAKA